MKTDTRSSLALYRKYRSKNFDEVIGQDHIVEVLKQSLTQKKLSHAYLFAGSRGTGKTSIARILAQELNTAPEDVYEIDAASNRGIDDIRELKESVSTVPFRSQYKMYIVDEVHMLTKEAFNALLKTLEEPPAHVIFVLATTEIDKLPDTIVSRCQTYVFKKPTVEILKKLVMSVSKKEGVALESAGAELIALLGDGSFRDTLGILEKTIHMSKDKTLSLSEIEQVTGAPRGTLVNDFIRACAERKTDGGLRVLAQVSSQHVDIKIFCRLVLEKMRLILLLSYDTSVEAHAQESVSGEDFLFLKTMSQKKENRITSDILYEFLTAYEKVGRSPIPELPLELSVIKLSLKEHVVKL